jgi:adenylate cyclase
MITTRRLAAILAADVAGYSAAMERDEEGTAAAVRALRREVIEPKLAEYQGRLIKTTGDGFLAEFASPIAALKCALAIQQRSDESDGLRLRIGLNLGDVIIEEGGDLLGEGVNVAARLESLAEPGGILISDKIMREVEGKVDAAFEDRGEQQVKNITRPVRVYSVGTANTRARAPSAPLPEAGKPLPLPDKPSIAVLPFQNMSRDAEQEYFADGVVEDIITALSKFRYLFVIARNSSFTYKGKAVDIKQVGRELGVRYVLEGSVRRSGNRVRITGQLIEAATGTHLWADRFDGGVQDIFELQDTVTERVVTAIFPRLQAAEFSRAHQQRPDNLDAYESFLQAQAVNRRQDHRENEKAVALLERAIALSPRYALAHALAASIHTGQYIAGRASDIDAVRSKALYFAGKAVELDPDDPDVLTYAANSFGNWGDPQRWEVLLRRAMELNPNSAHALFEFGAGQMYHGKHEEALECQARTLRLSPTGPYRVLAMSIMSMSHFMLGRDAEAHDWAIRAHGENPNAVLANRALVLSSIAVGDYERARMAFTRFATDLQQQLDRAKRMMYRPEDFKKFSDAMRQAAALP